MFVRTSSDLLELGSNASLVFARLSKTWQHEHVTIETKTNLNRVFVLCVSDLYFYMEQNVGPP